MPPPPPPSLRAVASAPSCAGAARPTSPSFALYVASRNMLAGWVWADDEMRGRAEATRLWSWFANQDVQRERLREDAQPARHIHSNTPTPTSTRPTHLDVPVNDRRVLRVQVSQRRPRLRRRADAAAPRQRRPARLAGCERWQRGSERRGGGGSAGRRRAAARRARGAARAPGSDARPFSAQPPAPHAAKQSFSIMSAPCRRGARRCCLPA